MNIEKIVDEKIIPFVFVVSSNPVLFHDLLEANRQISDRLIPNEAALGYRMKIRNTYTAFLILVHLFFILPIIALFHKPMAKLDCHISIILAIFCTGILFIGFSIFREYLIERISMQRLKEGWRLHFPLFDFDTHSKKIADIYTNAVKKKISRGELELYVMSELSKA